MNRELLQKCLTRMYGHFWADDLCAEIRSALAAPQPEPVAVAVAWLFTDNTGMKFVSVDCPHKDYKPLYAAPPAAPAPSNQLSGISGQLSDDDLLRIATSLGLPFGMLDTDYCKSLEIEPGTRSHGEVTCDGMVRFARAVIAAAPAPADTEGCVACVTCGQPWPAAPAAPAVPPFDLNCTCGAVWEVRGKDVELVHTAAPVVREPLTREQIAKALASAGLKPEDYRKDGLIEPLVWAIEQAHGIGGGGK